MDEMTANMATEEKEPVDRSATVTYKHFDAEQHKVPKKYSKLKMPTLDQLLGSTFKHRAALTASLVTRTRKLHGLYGYWCREVYVCAVGSSCGSW